MNPTPEWADSRPRVYKRAASKHGEVEVTVEGAEGETFDDIAEEAQEQFEDAVRGQEKLRGRDKDPKEGGFE